MSALPGTEGVPVKFAAEWLVTEWRSKLPQHKGVIGTSNKTAYYFRGKRAIKVLTSELYAQAVEAKPTLVDSVLELVNTRGKRVKTVADAPRMPTIKDEREAKVLLTVMLRHGFFHKCERYKKAGATENDPKHLNLLQTPSNAQIEEDEYYVWKIQEPARWATVVAFGLLIAIFLVMLFPLWPYELRVGVSYISMGLAIALVAFLVSLFTIRPLVWYVSSFFAPPGLWILPNANEDVGFFESFKPVWSYGTWEYPDPARIPPKKKAAAAAAAALAGDAASPDSADATSPTSPTSADDDKKDN